MAETQGWQFKTCKIYTRIESAYKVRKKIFVFYYVAVICTITKEKEEIRVVWAIMIDPPELPI